MCRCFVALFVLCPMQVPPRTTSAPPSLVYSSVSHPSFHFVGMSPLCYASQALHHRRRCSVLFPGGSFCRVPDAGPSQDHISPSFPG